MPDKPVALITGANQGIELQIAKELGGHGFTVLVGSRDIKRGEAAAKTIDGDARAIQLDVTDQAPIAAAAKRIRSDFGRLDVLVNNAAISHARGMVGTSVEEYAKSTRPSNVSLYEMRAVWETNVFGVVVIYQAMLPLPREAPAARIVNVSSGAGSLTRAADPTNRRRSTFGPRLRCVQDGPQRRDSRNGARAGADWDQGQCRNYAGTRTVEEGAHEPVRLALLGPDGPTGTFSNADIGPMPW